MIDRSGGDSVSRGGQGLLQVLPVARTVIAACEHLGQVRQVVWAVPMLRRQRRHGAPSGGDGLGQIGFASERLVTVHQDDSEIGQVFGPAPIVAGRLVQDFPRGVHRPVDVVAVPAQREAVPEQAA